ncbi:MAG: hypothetical protein U1F87_09420 [Kiritimatiellia bacterium]
MSEADAAWAAAMAMTADAMQRGDPAALEAWSRTLAAHPRNRPEHARGSRVIEACASRPDRPVPYPCSAKRESGGPIRPALRSIPLVAVDFETTGAVPGWPVEPWQLGLGPRFRSVVRPPRRSLARSLVRVEVPGRSTATPRAASGTARGAFSPRRRSPISALPALVGRGDVEAHNTSTERRMIRAMSPLHGPRAWLGLPLARRMFPGLPSHALGGCWRPRWACRRSCRPMSRSGAARRPA